MFTAASFTMVKKWKRPQCPSPGERINTMWYIHIREHYLVIKDVLTCATTRMNLEDIMLIKRSQVPKDHVSYDTIYLKNPE